MTSNISLHINNTIIKKRKKLILKKKDCDICTEQFDKNKNKEIKCEYCSFKVCRSCCETYILEKEFPKCMSPECNREWSRKFIMLNFTNTFIEGKLKKHRKKILFEKEKAKFPETLEVISEMEKIENYIFKLDDEIETSEELYKSIKDIKFNMFPYGKNESWFQSIEAYSYIMYDNIKAMSFENNEETDNIELHKLVENFINNIKFFVLKNDGSKINKTYFNILYYDAFNYRQIQLLKNKINIEFDKKDALWNNIESGRLSKYLKDDIKMFRCPTDNCKGMISCDKLTCILCKVNACIKCHERIMIEDEEHKCNPETVKTIELLHNETKPCPKCKTTIYKIDGCDQMWCTQCHTAFSWITGNVETKIHNPHYYEWLRSKSLNGVIPREQGDVPICEHIEINDHTITSICELITKKYIDQLNENQQEILIDMIETLIEGVIKCVDEIIYMREDGLYMYNTDNNYKSDFIYRSNYLKKNIDEETYKKYLEKESKRKIKNNEIYPFINTCINAKSDIVKRIMDVFNNNTTNFSTILDNISIQHGILNENYVLNDYIISVKTDIENTYKNKIKLFQDDI